jgi:GTP-binding protein HflX
LVASFKATLEEAINADLLLHVIDVSNSDVLNQIESVDKVLTEIGCGERPILKVFNKVDVLKVAGQLEMLQTLFTDAVAISAKTGYGLDKLSQAVTAKCRGNEVTLRISTTVANGKVQNYLRAHGTILEEHYLDSVVVIDARLGQNQLLGLQRLHPEAVEVLQD